jgi:glycosyltransferase involved in cell wall biosynthesis
MTQKKEIRAKIRLLHVVYNLYVGGAEVLLLHLIKGLGVEEYDHYVYYFGSDGPIRDKIEAFGVPVYKGKDRASIKQPIRFGTTLFFLMKDLLHLVRSRRIQIIQSHLGPANQLAVAVGKLSRTPVFPTVHTPMAFLDKRNRRDLRVHCNKGVNQYVYRSADRVLVVSQEIKETIQQHFSLKESKILFLKNGIVFEDDLLEPIDLGKEFSVSGSMFKLIAVGRLVSLKKFDMLIRAVKEVVNRGLDDLVVLIAGEGEERTRLEQLIQDFGLGDRVRLLGLRHDVMALMKASDIFVMPSRYEGVSLAMIEAMACGLPIIASDARGLKDCITDEQNGLLFPVDDYKALAERIQRLANDKKLRLRLSLGARSSFETEYDMRKNAKPLDMLFRKYATMRSQ